MCILSTFETYFATPSLPRPPPLELNANYLCNIDQRRSYIQCPKLTKLYSFNYLRPVIVQDAHVKSVIYTSLVSFRPAAQNYTRYPNKTRDLLRLEMSKNCVINHC